MRRVVVGLAITFGTFAPSWTRADDQQIAQQIVQELKANQTQGQLRGFKIDLQVDQGTVLLTGRVANAEQHQLALDVASKTPGVKQVVDDLKINPTAIAVPKTAAKEPSRNVANDADQHAPRRFALSNITRMKLLGSSDSKSEPASRTAKPNVRQEKSVLRNDRGAIANNEPRQSKSILSLLHRDAQPKYVPASQPIAVKPVALSENIAQSEHVAPAAAEAPARTSRPQADAENAVATTPIANDEQIAKQVFERLQHYKRTGKLQQFHLDMKVEEGTVWLDGRVANHEQKKLALEVARRVPGVYQVVDVIRVDADNTATVIPASTSESARRRPQDTRVAEVNVPAPGTFAPHGGAPLQAMPQNGYAAAVAAQPMPLPAYYASQNGVSAVRYDHPYMPGYAWPSYAAYPNYAAVTYPRQYSAAAWPYIGPFYPYPQVPLGWRKVSLEWDDGWWYLDFCEK